MIMVTIITIPIIKIILTSIKSKPDDDDLMTLKTMMQAAI